MVYHRRIRSALAYHQIPQYKLAQEIGMSKASMANKMSKARGWDLMKDVVPMVRYFNSLGDTWTIEELFELDTKGDTKGEEEK